MYLSIRKPSREKNKYVIYVSDFQTVGHSQLIFC